MHLGTSFSLRSFVLLVTCAHFAKAQFTNSSTAPPSSSVSLSSISQTTSSDPQTSSSSELTPSSTESETTLTTSYIPQATYTEDITIVGDVEFGELKVGRNATLTLLNGNNYTFKGGLETQGNIRIIKTVLSHPGVRVDLDAPFWFHDGSFTVLDSGAETSSEIFCRPYFFSMSGTINFDLSRSSPGNATLGYFVNGGTFTFASAIINFDSRFDDIKVKRASIGSMINDGQIVLTEGSLFAPTELSGNGIVELNDGDIVVDSTAYMHSKVVYSGRGTLVIDDKSYVQGPISLDGYTGDYQLAFNGNVSSLEYESGVLEINTLAGFSYTFEIGDDFDIDAFYFTDAPFSYAGHYIDVNYVNYGKPPTSSSSSTPTPTSSDKPTTTTSVYTTTVTSGTTSTVVIISCVPTTDAQGNTRTVTYTLPCPYTTTVTFSSCSSNRCTDITTTRTVTPTTTTRSKRRCTPSIKTITVTETSTPSIDTITVTEMSTVMSCPPDHCFFCLDFPSTTLSDSTFLPTLSTTFNESSSVPSTTLNYTIYLPTLSIDLTTITNVA